MYFLRRIIYSFLLSLCAFSGAVVADDDFLPVAEAFPVSATLEAPDSALVAWDLPEGYFLYKGKISFSTTTRDFTLGEPVLPKGKIKVDEFFGKVEVLRHRVEARIPVEQSTVGGGELELKVRFQGCADAGLCYPPQRKSYTLALPSEPPAAATTQPTLGELAGAGAEAVIPVEQAFVLNAAAVDAERVELSWQIAPGTYLYEEKISVRLLQGEKSAVGEGITLGSLDLPKPVIKPNSVRPDGTTGEVAAYDTGFAATVPLTRSDSGATEVTLEVNYQGCAAIGVCYPPRSEQITIELPAVASPAEVASADQASTPAPQSAAGTSRKGEVVSEQDKIADTLRGGNMLWTLLTFFGFGALLALTPCVFPMIPILSGIIAGQKHTSARKSFILSVVYVLSMSLTYAVAGVLAAIWGGNLQVAFQDPVIISAFVAVFIALSLSMFGFYELQLPSSLQSKLSDISNRQQGGHLIGVAIMGLLSALIVGPCVAPPLAGALIYVGQTGDWVLGGLALFVMAIGMGLPLLLIGASAGKLLPRAGAWMDAIKAVFGIGLLAVAIVLLERVVPPAVAMVLWGTLMVVSGVYMGALNHLPEGASGWFRLWKGLGLVLVIYGAMMLIGASAGGKDTVQPLRGIGGVGGESAAAHLQFKEINTVEDLEREVAAAGKPVILDFYADWCVSCKEMERYTFSDPAVIAQLQDFVLLQADVTEDDENDRALLQGHFGLPGPPAIIIYGADGVERSNYRVVGFLEAEPFSAHVAEAVQ